MAKLAKSSKPSSPKATTGTSRKSKPDTSAPKDADHAEVVSETVSETVSDMKEDALNTSSPAAETKADALPELEPVDAETVAEADPDMPQDAAPEAAHEPEPAQTPPAASSNGGLFGSVLGGVIAGAIGFGASMLILPYGWRGQDDTGLTALQSTVTQQESALKAATADLEGSIATTKEALEGEIAALSETDTALSAGIDGLNTRLEELTQGDGTTKLPDDVQILLNAQKEEISKLQATVAGMAEDAKAQMEAASAQQQTAEQAEARVKARGAAQGIRLALLSGEPFADALDLLAPAVEVPAALAAVAENGAPTSADVSEAFPPAARAALSKAVRETAGDDTQSRIKLFFQDQLSARSLSPQEGDSADAVLSRAEAAVKVEDYRTALTEIEALPESAQAELAEWRAQAEARLGAVEAFTAVTDALNSN